MKVIDICKHCNNITTITKSTKQTPVPVVVVSTALLCVLAGLLVKALKS